MKIIIKIISFLFKLFLKLKKKEMFNEEKYKKLLGQMESSGNYRAYNPEGGAKGKYQFMSTTLDFLEIQYGLPVWDNANYFLSNPSLQEKYIKAQIKFSLNYIRKSGLSQYFGTMVQGSKRFQDITVPINVYGLLAAIHLSGAGNVSKYFLFGSDPDDGLTSLTDYMAYFSSKFNSNGQNAFLAALAMPSDVTLFSFVGLAIMVGIVLSYK